jgi:hypothetical protein
MRRMWLFSSTNPDGLHRLFFIKAAANVLRCSNVPIAVSSLVAGALEIVCRLGATCCDVAVSSPSVPTSYS